MGSFLKVILPLIFLLLSCSDSDVAGGGNDVGNGYIQAIVVDSLNIPVSNASAELVGVIITSKGDSSFLRKTVLSDNLGICRFSEIPSGNFVLSVSDTSSKINGILSRIKIEDDSIISDNPIMMNRVVTLKGRIANWDNDINKSVVVPGILKSFKPDIDGFYIIPDMFVGNYDICLVSDTVVNYLSVSVKEGSDDTIYVRDINFADSYGDNASSYSYYINDLKKSFQIVPQYYTPQNKPLWYENHDFSFIEYLENIDGNDTLSAQWIFPVIVGVNDTLIRYYGNDCTAVVTLVKNQLKDAVDNFNLATFNTIEFSLDSFYIIPTDVETETVMPPDGYSVRILYKGFWEAGDGLVEWYHDQRTGVNIYTSDNSSIFGIEGLLNTMWLLGHSRGCFNLTFTEVDSADNDVTGKGFYIPDYVMSNESATEWSPTNKMIIEYNGGAIQPSLDTVYSRFPDTINILFEDSLLQALSNINVKIFASPKWRNSIPDSVAYSGNTNSFGIYTFPNNPFVDSTGYDVKHDALLIRGINLTDTSYYWFPMFEVIDSCFLDAKSSYTKRIVLE